MPYALSGHSQFRKALPAIEKGAKVNLTEGLRPDATQVYAIPDTGRGIHVLRSRPRRPLYDLSCGECQRAFWLTDIHPPNASMVGVEQTL